MRRKTDERLRSEKGKVYPVFRTRSLCATKINLEEKEKTSTIYSRDIKSLSFLESCMRNNGFWGMNEGDLPIFSSFVIQASANFAFFPENEEM